MAVNTDRLNYNNKTSGSDGVFPHSNFISMSTCAGGSTCMSEMCICFRQCEVESLQSSQQRTVSAVVPEVASLVAVAVAHTGVTPQYTLKTHTHTK